MEFSQISEEIQRNAAWVVFVNVLMQQMGLPIPAVPTLLVAGSLVLSLGQASQLLAAAVMAAVIADYAWYVAGVTFGYRVLSGLCKFSINPASCVSEAEGYFMRWGAKPLIVAKFVPGFSTVAPPIAGSLRMPLPGFIAASGLGATLWAGLALMTGWIFRGELQAALAGISQHGMRLIIVVLIAFSLWFGWKFWQRHRFLRMASIPHISASELVEALSSADPPLLLDLRQAGMIATTGPVSGATVVPGEGLSRAAQAWSKDRPIVTMCACPGDATAVTAARKLLQMGYLSVHPLKGGYDALVSAIHDTEISAQARR